MRDRRRTKSGIGGTVSTPAYHSRCRAGGVSKIATAQPAIVTKPNQTRNATADPAASNNAPGSNAKTAAVGRSLEDTRLAGRCAVRRDFESLRPSRTIIESDNAQATSDISPLNASITRQRPYATCPMSRQAAHRPSLRRSRRPTAALIECSMLHRAGARNQ